MGRWDKGLAHARAAVACAPTDAKAWCRLAEGMRAAGHAGPAREAAQRALSLDPQAAAPFNMLGFLAQDAGDLAAARDYHRRALSIDPHFGEARVGLAQCDEAEGRVDAALEGFREAASIDPRCADAPYGLGRIHHLRTGRIGEAIAAYRQAIALRPGFAYAHHNLAHALFLAGDFAAAWNEYRWRPPRLRYEARLRRLGHDPSLPAGLPAGARLRVLGEQGLGDTLFFLRFAPLLRERGARLAFAGDARLSGMLERTGLFDSIGESPEEDDATEVLAADLPLLLASAQAGAVPEPLALAAEPARIEAMRARLAALGPPPYATLAWRAGIAQGGVYETLYKELAPEALGTALAGLRATWLAVQREPRSGDIDALSDSLGARVHDLSSVNEDLEDALALMSIADEWIGVSNTNVHLRAGAGGSARVLVPFPPEWRWMAERDSPWFASMRTYRQSADRSWREALAQMASGLSGRLTP